MKPIFILAIALSVPVVVNAGDLWEWAPGHWTYTDDKGHVSEGWRWAPGHVTWTDQCGHTREVWEWAPGHFSVEDN